MMKNYMITWKYVVETMEKKYGFKPDNIEECSFSELMRYLEGIWEEYYYNKNLEVET